MKPGLFNFLGFSKNAFINNIKSIPSLVKNYKELKAGLKNDV